MTDIRVPKKVVTAPYWNLGDHFVRFDEAQDLSAGALAILYESLGLGTMATRDAGTGGSQHRDNSQNDGRFMQPGAFGLGGNGIPVADQAALDALDAGGFYRLNFVIASVASSNSQVLHLPSNSGRAMQIIHRQDNGDLLYRWKPSGGSWSDLLPIKPAVTFVPNGRIIRFADGTQICMEVLDVGQVTVSIGAIYRTANIVWNYPAAFFGTPDVVGGMPHLSNAWMMRGGSMWRSDNAEFYIARPIEAAVNVSVSLFAVGRYY